MHVCFLQVEKQKIIKNSAGKLLNQTNEGDRSEVSSTISQKAAADSNASTLGSSKGSSKRNSTTLQMQLNSATNGGKDPTPAKKHSSRATNFFDR